MFPLSSPDCGQAIAPRGRLPARARLPLAVVLFLFGFRFLSFAQAPFPVLGFEQANWDFGQVFAGAPVQHAYYFTNLSGRDLTVDRVVAGCSCTRVGNWTRQVPAGGQGSIPIELTTGGFVGPVEKAISVFCDGGSQPVACLGLRGGVRRVLDLRPPTAFLSLGPDQPHAQASVTISNCLEEPVWLFAPQTTNPAFAVTLATNVPGRAYSVLVSNTAWLTPGASSTTIMLGASPSNLPPVTLLALVNSTPLFTLAPDTILLSASGLTTGQTAHVHFFNNSTNPVALCNATVNAAGALARLTTNRLGQEYSAVVCLPPGGRVPTAGVFLRLDTSSPDYRVVTVPIQVSGSPMPPAPVVKRTPFEVVTAPSPLVIEYAAINRLHLDADQAEAVGQLQTQFIEAIGGLSQDPFDPQYLARWHRAQSAIDARLVGVIGRVGVIRLDQAISKALPADH